MLSGNNKKKIQDFSCTHGRMDATLALLLWRSRFVVTRKLWNKENVLRRG